MRIAASIAGPLVVVVPLVVVAATVVVAQAQPARVVRGVVVRAGTPTPIAGASVLTDRGEIAVTDIDGFFAIQVGGKDRELTVAANGYQPKTVAIKDAARIELSPASGAEVIEITGKAPEETKPVSYSLSVDEIVAIPGAGNDILRAATVLPGVARIPFSFGALVLRGTSPRDTSVYLDGVEVPIAFHFGGITSFYPSGMLSDLAVTAGGFDASYGRATGGLVTLSTREPRSDRWRMGGSVGLFDSSIMAEGPWKGGGLLVGVRRSYLDRIVDPFLDDRDPLPSYWDFQLRTTFGDPRKRGRVTPMIFGSIDRIASNEISMTSMFVRIAVPYTRTRGAFTWRIVPWLGTNRLSFHEEAEVDPMSGQVLSEEQSFVRPMYPGGVRAEVTRDYQWGHLRGGGELTINYLDQIAINVSDEELGGNSTLLWNELALFGEWRYKLDGDRFAIKPAVRLEVYGLTGEVVFDPRLNIHQKLTDKLTLRQSFGRFHQPPTPGDVDPEAGNPALLSSYTDQLSLGVDTELPKEILATATAFFNYGRQIGVKVTNPRPGSEMVEPNIGGLGPTFELLLEKQLGFPFYREPVGRARSYGIELLLKRNVGKLFTLLSYTLQKSERTDDPRLIAMSGQVRSSWRAFELDQRHNLQVAASYQLTKWRVGGRVQLVSGNPYTPEGATPFSARLPTFFTIDLRADRRWRRCWGDLVFFMDIQNVMNRRNIEGREPDDIKGLPIIPFLGVEFRPTI